MSDEDHVEIRATYRDQVRAALAETDSSWGEATGDGDASQDYIDTLTESVAYLRDDELAKTAVAYAAQVAELNAELAGLRERAVIVLPEDWRGRIRDCVNQPTANRLVALIESWRAAPEPAAPTQPPSSLERDPDAQSSIEDTPRRWKRGDRVSWTNEFGTHFGVVLEDQIGTDARVQPDNTNETGALIASSLSKEAPHV